MGPALNGSRITLKSFAGNSGEFVVDRIRRVLQAAGWSQFTLLHAGLPGTYTNGQATVRIGSNTYRIKERPNNYVPNEVKLGATATETLYNLKAAINGEPGKGTKYSAETVPHPDIELTEVSGATFTLAARKAGPDGDLLTVSYAVGVTWPQGTHFLGAGYDMLCESPQGYAARLQIYRKTWYHYFDYPPVALRFTSTDGKTLGYEHAITYRSGLVYRLWANCCQVFLAGRGCNGDDHTAFQGGVPFVPDFAAAGVSQIWWSMGDRAHFFGMQSLRTRLASTWPACGCVNGGVTFGFDREGGGCPRVLTLGPFYDWFALFRDQKLVYYNGTPFYIDPLVAWGRPGEKFARVRGQLWDAVIKTRAMEMDAVEQWDSQWWFNYTHNHLYGGLLLLCGEGMVFPPGTGPGPGKQASYAY